MIGSSSTQYESSSSSSDHNQSSSTAMPIQIEQQLQMDELIAKWQDMTFDDSQIPSLIESIESTANLEKHYYGVIGLRKALCNEGNPPIDQVLDSGIVPTLIEIMKYSKEFKIRFEAAWALTNLCSGTSEQTQEVIDCGVIPGFLAVLHTGDSSLMDQSIWGLGNIAGDSTDFRDLIIEEGGVEAIANVLEDVASISLKRNGAWALSNCCRGKPEPPLLSLSRAFSVFCKFLKTENDEEILADSAWGLSWNSEENPAIQIIIKNGVIPVLVSHLSSAHSTLIAPCLRVIGNVISGTDEQTAVVLKEKNLLPTLLKLATHKTKKIRREAFWTISNITAGQPVQFEGIMGNPAFVETIIKAAKKEKAEVQKEAIYVLSNSTSTGTPAQIIRLLNNGVFQCLCELLGEFDDESMLTVVLEGIENCLKWGKQFNLVNEEGVNKFFVELAEQGGLDKLENLQNHQSSEVYERVIRILENYFETE